MSIVVSDTSPIRAFHFLRQISLLQRLFGAVIIPPAVANELIHPAHPFEPLDLSVIPFVEVRAPHDQQRVAHYANSLDIGEAEAITLAAELGALLLIDEIDGRAAAAAAGIPFVGVLGVLARAKREHLMRLPRINIVREFNCHRSRDGKPIIHSNHAFFSDRCAQSDQTAGCNRRRTSFELATGTVNFIGNLENARFRDLK